ncbi:hypothetical protein GGS23DRAFT_549899 [Durotheca rogersii]|uniref:uncharacterized protein n=1 Tax=Durotheca rogersii TaxID=419775 RepID=UPI0022203414|nr:uncharacterized protein GGS23DRAFT_549899 [Durotheca rogersii]KAI5867779.1 hypothetical protein GGS23DRAFT_549899 [Durotheca rogersii]
MKSIGVRASPRTSCLLHNLISARPRSCFHIPISRCYRESLRALDDGSSGSLKSLPLLRPNRVYVPKLSAHENRLFPTLVRRLPPAAPLLHLSLHVRPLDRNTEGDLFVGLTVGQVSAEGRRLLGGETCRLRRRVRLRRQTVGLFRAAVHIDGHGVLSRLVLGQSVHCGSKSRSGGRCADVVWRRCGSLRRSTTVGEGRFICSRDRHITASLRAEIHLMSFVPAPGPLLRA